MFFFPCASQVVACTVQFTMLSSNRFATTGFDKCFKFKSIPLKPAKYAEERVLVENITEDDLRVSAALQ